MNGIVPIGTDQVLVQNRPLQVVNKLSMMMKDVSFKVVFSSICMHKPFGNVNAVIFPKQSGFTNRQLILPLSSELPLTCCRRL